MNREGGEKSKERRKGRGGRRERRMEISIS